MNYFLISFFLLSVINFDIVRFEAIAIVGATASGKSEIAVKIGRKLREKGYDVEFISADSRKIFKYFDIGTAKPVKYLKEFRWHFISELEPWQKFSAKDFEVKAKEIIKKLKSERKIPIVVGGTWFYIRALEKGLYPEPEDRNLRSELEKILIEKGKAELFEFLKKVDLKAAEKINPNDSYRVIRAIEIKLKTGKSITEIGFLDEISGEKFPLLKLGIWRRKSEIKERIKTRIQKQIREGLIEETRYFINETLKKKYMIDDENGNEKSTQQQEEIIPEYEGRKDEFVEDRKELLLNELDEKYGVKIPAVLMAIACYEPFLYVIGKISFDDMVELMVRRNFKYAKYQLKVFSREGSNWFRNEDELIDFSVRESVEMINQYSDEASLKG